SCEKIVVHNKTFSSREGDASGYLPLHTLLHESFHSVSFYPCQCRPPEHQGIYIYSCAGVTRPGRSMGSRARSSMPKRANTFRTIAVSPIIACHPLTRWRWQKGVGGSERSKITTCAGPRAIIWSPILVRASNSCRLFCPASTCWPFCSRGC